MVITQPVRDDLARWAGTRPNVRVLKVVTFFHAGQRAGHHQSQREATRRAGRLSLVAETRVSVSSNRQCF